MKCKNDSSKTYKGNEPSPKGLGYCAHAEKNKSIRVGKDGNKWIIKEVSNGSKRWVKLSSTSKKLTSSNIKTRKTKKNNKQNKKLKSIDNINNEYEKISKEIPKGTKLYFTHYNGSRPYLVYIFNKSNKVMIKIFRFDDKKFESSNNSNGNKKYYVTHVKDYIVDNQDYIFIGKSPKNKMTTFSAGFGSKYDGNTILLYLGKIGNKYKYVYLMYEVFEFTTDYEITKFVSPLGNNDVPYPFAIDTENNFYLLLEKMMIINENNLIDKNEEDPYTPYYSKDIKGKLKLKKISGKVLNKVDY